MRAGIGIGIGIGPTLLVGRPQCALCGCTATSAALCWLVADLSRVDDQRAAATEAHWLRYGLESASG